MKCLLTLGEPYTDKESRNYQREDSQPGSDICLANVALALCHCNCNSHASGGNLLDICVTSRDLL